jgi:hypothetical protein
MADTGGIAALLKALNETPALGAGLKAPASTGRASSSNFASVAGIAKPASTAATTATTTAATARPIRTAASYNGVKPKTLSADGVSYNARAPRGTYLDLVV